MAENPVSSSAQIHRSAPVPGEFAALESGA